MALPRAYSGQACSIAKALEIVGERWTLLIVRDACFGVRRFSEFVAHLDIPRAVLAERLAFLVAEGILERSPAGGRDEYVLTSKGEQLFPVLRALAGWGDDYYAPAGRRRITRHASCGSVIERTGICPTCGTFPELVDLETVPGPGFESVGPDADPVSEALARPRRMLEPIAATRA
jgi:DNA-binding HxlR family transcriptional regulator